ncbi:exopolysaccharide biosynthesis polyprenyl glycosylphosphotransferase [Bizionia sediminis]|uniref:Exopolysaccharide biosynthesis polyprenyl glycosylphosphotransferase n=1 Tax=Bizionia sediminis TaxID=1737064 RepID=A0ABW5KUF0_9FLAO
MSQIKHGRYSIYIRPISYAFDLGVINILAVFYFFPNINPIPFTIVTTLGWIFISVKSGFYEVFRYTKEVTIISLAFKQMVLFGLFVFAFSGFYSELDLEPRTILKYIGAVFLIVTAFKITFYYLLQKYRSVLGGNFRTTVIIGRNKQSADLEKFFNTRPEYGYKLKKTFSLKDKNGSTLEACFKFLKEEAIEELYCSVSELTNSEMSRVIDFADNNLIVLKFIPDNKDIYAKKLRYEYYDYIPVLSLRNIALDDPANLFVKRFFDIVFSACVILFILSWLTPIIAILIKLESKGPVFFKQTRNGFNYQEFNCYKFRSMMPNKDAHLYQATRDDQRITKIGRFIRKTSIDELPQFYNVFFGDMSVVGPRPHMVSHTNMYAKRIDKFMVRHFVKPGITGLAQISGFRGEVETDKDIIGRVKFDIFYIENWSLLLDLKIIIKTFLNAIKGEEKAY